MIGLWKVQKSDEGSRFVFFFPEKWKRRRRVMRRRKSGALSRRSVRVSWSHTATDAMESIGEREFPRVGDGGKGSVGPMNSGLYSI